MPQGTDFHEHPEYERQKDDWQTWKDLFEGKHAVLISDKYLWRHELEDHPVEGNKLRQMRARRSRYLNLIEPVLSVFAGLFFKEEPVIDESVKTLFGDAWKDVDGEGNSFLAFFKGPVLLHYLRDGKAIVHTDATEFKGETKADEVGHRGYLKCIDPLAAKDWVETQGEEYQLFRYEYCEVKPRTSLSDKPQEVLYTKVLALQGRTFTVTTFRKPVDAGASSKWEQDGPPETITLDRLPVAVACGESWIKDVAELQLVLFNLLSAYYNQLNHQAFQRPVFSGNLDTDQKKAWSEFSAMVVPPGTEVTVIEPSDMTALENGIEKTIDRLFKVAFNRTQALAANTKAVASDDTIRELKDDLFVLIENEIERLENLANQIVQDYAAFKGQKEFKGKITLSREITTEDVAEQLEILATLRTDMFAVLPWKKAILRKFLERQNLPEKDEKEILAEIEKLKEQEPLLGMGLLPQLRTNGGQDTNAGGATKGGPASDPAIGNAGRSAGNPPPNVPGKGVPA